MRKQVIILVLFIFCINFTVGAQGQGGGMEMPSNGKIIGKIADGQGNPVEYASISLISLRDSAIVGGAVSDAQGNFKMMDLKLGVYALKIKVLGFETKEISPIYLMPKGKGKGEGIEQDFGTIALGTSDIQINDVTVVGEKSRVQYKIDKKVINASADINSASGTAVDILENTPSVSVDIEGNVSLRGSGSFTVLVDGKPTALEGSEALQAIPASMIDNIEIITNPSAKFDPEGAAGIINVILKKRKTLGVNGIANVSAGTNDKYGANFTLNYKVGKFNLTGGIDFRDDTRYMTGIMNTVSDLDTIIRYSNSNSNNKMNHGGLGFQFGVDYYFNDNNTISISGRGGNRKFNRFSSRFYNDYTSPSTMDEYYVRNSDGGFEGLANNLNFDFEHKFKLPGQKINLSFNFSRRDGTRLDERAKYETDATGIINDDNPDLSKSEQVGPSDEYEYKADFVSPLGKSGNIEAGFQGSSETENEELVYTDYNPLTGNWEKDNLRSSAVDFSESTQALYATYASKITGIDFKLGLRAEYYNRYLNQKTINEEYSMDIYDLFPSAYLTRQISKADQIQLNYSRRINRPGGRQLDPFKDYSDPRNIRSGNPFLYPEYIDSYELNYQRTFKQSFVSVETYYRRTTNKISDWKENLQGDTSLIYPKNLEYDNSLGVEFNANLVFAKWWRLNLSGTTYYYQLKTDSVLNESVNWNLRLNNSFSFKTKTRVQLTGFYNGPSATAQGTRDGFFFSNLSVRQDLLKDKLSITLSCQDIFGTSTFAITEANEVTSYYSKFSREARVFTLAFAYKINNFKQKRNGEGREENMDMDMDMRQ